MEVLRVYEPGNEACYLLCCTKTWQLEEEVSATSTEYYHSSQVETIKIEEIEHEEYKNIHLVVLNESEILKIKESFLPEVANVASKSVGCTIEHSEVKTKTMHYSCDECAKVFKLKGYLRGHKLTHEGITALACDQCESSFTYNSDLKRQANTQKY